MAASSISPKPAAPGLKSETYLRPQRRGFGGIWWPSVAFGGHRWPSEVGGGGVQHGRVAEHVALVERAGVRVRELGRLRDGAARLRARRVSQYMLRQHRERANLHGPRAERALRWYSGGDKEAISRRRA